MIESVLKPIVNYSMTCKTDDLQEAMKFLKIAIPKDKRGKLYNCEITIKTNEVNFVVIGASKVIYCNATGPVKVSLPFWYFNDIVKLINTPYVKINISEGFLSIGNLNISTSTCFFKDDSILRSIKLPLNYTLSDLFRIHEYYTPEEIAFNKLDILIKNNLDEIGRDIDKISLISKKYGFVRKEIEQFVFEKINYHPKMHTYHE